MTEPRTTGATASSISRPPGSCARARDGTAPGRPGWCSSRSRPAGLATGCAGRSRAAGLCSRSCGTERPQANERSVYRVEDDDRDLALGLLLVVGIGRPEFQRLLPEPGAFLAGCGAGAGLELLGADLHFDLGIGEEVAIPARVLRRAAFRGDDDIAVAGLPVEKREN